jgi:hypothetical protein
LIITSGNRLMLACILFFPISIILQGIPLLGWISKAMFAAVFLLFIISFFVDRITNLTLVLFIITVISSCFTFAYTGKAFNFNSLLYFPFWMCFFLYLKNNYFTIMNLLSENLKWLKNVLVFWNVLVFVSLFFPGNYRGHWGTSYFMSFSNAEHRFASSCMLVFVFSWFLVQQTKKKKDAMYGILPLLGVLLSGARVYLGVAFILIVSIYYILCKSKKRFYFTIIPICLLAIIIILISPVGYKFVLTFQGNGYYGYWATLTSGRSMFWIDDLKAFWQLDWWHKFVGNGANFVYEVNEAGGNGKIWAHNDLINLLLSNGIIGTCLYLVVFLNFTGSLMKKKYNIPTILVWSFYGIWFFNAMTNMVYSYLCTVIAIPFILYSLCHFMRRGELCEEE